jgi:putative 4-mercaptohistidine N1-methyltranferase
VSDAFGAPIRFPPGVANIYETDRLLAEYLLFHYAGDDEILPWAFGPREALGYPVRTARAVEWAGKTADGCGRALDLGCAVGRSSFELARYYGEVIGLDFSHRFIDAARVLAGGGSIGYPRLEEGEVTTPLQARAPAGIDHGRVRFLQGDAGQLPSDWEGFDCVHAANLLCRLPAPARLVAGLPRLVAPGGLLVLATPCSWLEEFTPRSHWLGGVVEDGRPVRTFDRLKHLLNPHFVLEMTCDEPFLIREHARKFQWSVAQVSVWKRRRKSK